MNIYIGANIKRLRLKKQVTQEQLSLAMGVTCAAVSKWERENTLPDISLLPLLANYFDVSIDELMGYNAAKIEEEINEFFEEHRRLFKDGKVEEYTKLSEKAYKDYPNDYRVMVCYMWDKVGNYADNDLSVILANKEELLSICQRVSDGCNDVHLRLDAINMQGKILYAEGKTEEAVALYKKEIPDWYLTSGQKTEQLFAKDTPEFARQLRFNMLELGMFAVNKKCKELWFCNNLSVEDKGKTAVSICKSLEELTKTATLYEVDYYIWCFAKDMIYKLEHWGNAGDTADAESLRLMAESAKKRFVEYSKKDKTVSEYCKAFM